jgi:hypothetical protein
MANCNNLARLQELKEIEEDKLKIFQLQTALFQEIKNQHQSDGYLKGYIKIPGFGGVPKEITDAYAEIQTAINEYAKNLNQLKFKRLPQDTVNELTQVVSKVQETLKLEQEAIKAYVSSWVSNAEVNATFGTVAFGVVTALFSGFIFPPIGLTAGAAAFFYGGITVSFTMLVGTGGVLIGASYDPRRYASGAISLFYEARIRETETKIQINRLTSKINELLKYCDLPDAICPIQSKYQGKLFNRADILEKLDGLEEKVPGTETNDPKILQLNEEIKNHNSEIAILDNDITKYSAFYNLVNNAQANLLKNQSVADLNEAAIGAFNKYNTYNANNKVHRRAISSLMAYMALEQYADAAVSKLNEIADFGIDNIQNQNIKSIMKSIKKMARTDNNYGLTNWTPINELIVRCPSSLGCHYLSTTDKLVSFPSPRNGWKTFADSISDNIYDQVSVEGLKFPGLEKLLNDMKSKLISISAIIQRKETLQSQILVKTLKIAAQKTLNRKDWNDWINQKLNEYYDFSSPNKISKTTTRIPVTKALIADGKPAFKEHIQIKKEFGFDFTYNSDNFTYLFEIAQNHLKAGQAKAAAEPFPDGSSGDYPIYTQSDINYKNVNTAKGYSHPGTTHKVYASVVPTTNKLDPVLATIFSIGTGGIPELTANLSICAE